jgi:hypothetical protein
MAARESSASKAGWVTEVELSAKPPTSSKTFQRPLLTVIQVAPGLPGFGGFVPSRDDTLVIRRERARRIREARVTQ